jgi:ABC-2 type transport system permease protein
MIGPYGEYILYVTALMMLVTLRFYLERRRLLRIRDRQVAALAQVPGEAA